VRVVIVGKYPPLQGGVSAQTYWTARSLAERGYDVDVVTNATEAAPGLRAFLGGDAGAWLAGAVGQGRLRVHATEGLARHSYLPWSNPFASKLFGRTLEVIGSDRCDGILGWYFEPYGLVAVQAGEAAGAPVAVRHAGSDLGRLAAHPDLRPSYRWMLGRARAVITGSRRGDARARLEALAPAGTEFVHAAGSRVPSIFSPTAAPLDVAALLGELPAWFDGYPMARSLVERIGRVNARAFDRSLATVGVYGKVGEVKGTYDLLAALDALAARQVPFNFLAVACGTPGRLTEFYESVTGMEHLARRTYLLPPLAPWLVPGFLKACDVVCALERSFPIRFHTPALPREILAAGTCLVISRELAEKQGVRESLVDLRNCAIVEDPRDRTALAGRFELLLTDLARARVIGKHGLYLSKAYEELLDSHDATADVVDRLVREWTR
jgi:glycosyltransferase involved in cell wall biosynthesis